MKCIEKMPILSVFLFRIGSSHTSLEQKTTHLMEGMRLTWEIHLPRANSLSAQLSHRYIAGANPIGRSILATTTDYDVGVPWRALNARK